MTPPNTPGSAGYVLAALIASAVCGLVMELPVLGDGGSPLAALVYLPIAAVIVMIFGFPVMLVESVIVQGLCFRIRQQAVHVVVAGAAAYGLTRAYDLVLDVDSAGPDPGVVALAATLGAAAGRACVIPLVNSRRRLAVEGRLTGTARW